MNDAMTYDEVVNYLVMTCRDYGWLDGWWPISLSQRQLAIVLSPHYCRDPLAIPMSIGGWSIHPQNSSLTATNNYNPATTTTTTTVTGVTGAYWSSGSFVSAVKTIK